MATPGAITPNNKSAPSPSSQPPLAAVARTNNGKDQHQQLPTPPSPATKQIPTTAVSSRPPEQQSDVIIIPSYSRWFSWSKIHECEVRHLPEFFEARSASKNPRVYKYYRNSIIQRFRENPTRKITFTEARKTIIGDVGSVRRVFDFLEAWGLINYLGAPSSKPQKGEDKDATKSAGAASSTGLNESGVSATEFTGSKKRFCSMCKSVCSIACFARDKDDVSLCARCFVRGSYKVGPNPTDFRRVEISDEVKTAEWTDKETLHLLEAIMHYRDDWKKVAEHVGGRSARECVAQFVKLPFGEQFVGPPDSAEVDDNILHQPNDQRSQSTTESPTKKMRLTPLADTSNPIMAQAAFLSALVGVDVAKASAQAAVWALYETSNGKESLGSLSGGGARQQDSNATTTASVKASEEARLELEKEENELEQAISGIVELQMKEIRDKIVHFEEFDLQMERASQQLQQMKNQLFVDQLTLLFHKSAAAPKSQQSTTQDVKPQSMTEDVKPQSVTLDVKPGPPIS